MFLVTTLIAVALGLTVNYPVIGVPLVVVSIPVLFRTIRIVQARLHSGHDVKSVEKVKVFLWTLSAVLALMTFWCASAIVCLVGIFGTFENLWSNYDVDASLMTLISLTVGGLGLLIGNRWNKKLENRYHRELAQHGMFVTDVERTADWSASD